MASVKPSSGTIGERIRQSRKAAGLSRTTLARQAGVSQPAVWNWEQQGRTPHRGTLAKVAEALGVAESFLRTGSLAPGPGPASIAAPPTAPPAVVPQILAAVLDETRAKIAEVTGLSLERVSLRLEITSEEPELARARQHLILAADHDGDA